MANAITHITREQLIERYVSDIILIERKDGETMSRAYLLDLIAEVVRALNGTQSDETARAGRAKAAVNMGKINMGR